MSKPTLAEAVERMEVYFVLNAKPTPEEQEAWAVIKAELPVWRPIESAPDGRCVLYKDARGNRWIDAYPDITGNWIDQKQPPIGWMELPK